MKTKSIIMFTIAALFLFFQSCVAQNSNNMKTNDKQSFKEANYFGTGISNFMMRKNMTGKTYIKPLKMAGRSMFLANVTFESGARCFWHVHRGTNGGGQIIICTAGEGWYQEEGKEPVSLTPGSVVYIPTDLVHWHGAKKDSWFSHIAVEIGGEGVKNEFIRPVSEAEYAALPNVEAPAPQGATEFDRENVFGKGDPNTMFAAHFDGESYLNPLTPYQPGKPFVANVTFEPGCRNHWHIHKATSGGGQILVCTAGDGWYQEEGKTPQALHKGDIVYIPAGVKHWHGATYDGWFSHLSIEVPGENTATEWFDDGDKNLVVYFSASGKTEMAAKAIVETLGGSLHAIKPAQPYTAADLDWHNKQSRTTLEMNDRSSRPAICADSIDMGNYDKIYLGFPIWWGTAPTIVNTFIESHDLKGKTVVIFATSGGSKTKKAFAELSEQYPDIHWVNGGLMNRTSYKKITKMQRQQK